MQKIENFIFNETELREIFEIKINKHIKKFHYSHKLKQLRVEV